MTNLPPGWRLFADLTKAEAQRLLDTYVAELASRADSFVGDVRRRGGPADQLDYSRGSLVPLWAWFIANHRLPDPPVSEETMRASDPPWWFDFHAPLGMELGPDLARLTTLLAAYVATTALRERPASTWVLGSDRRLTKFRMPLLEIDGRAQWSVDTSLVVVTLNALGPDRLNAHREGLQNVYDMWTGSPRPSSISAPLPEQPPYWVEPIDRPGFSHEISVDDVVAHDEENRVKRFVELLKVESGILKAQHEDREIILVNAPGLGSDDLEAIIDRAWQSAGPGVYP